MLADALLFRRHRPFMTCHTRHLVRHPRFSATWTVAVTLMTRSAPSRCLHGPLLPAQLLKNPLTLLVLLVTSLLCHCRLLWQRSQLVRLGRPLQPQPHAAPPPTRSGRGGLCCAGCSAPGLARGLRSPTPAGRLGPLPRTTTPWPT
eukprot:Rmarinus@m.12996